MLLNRDDWYETSRDVDWTLSYVDRNAAFPPSWTGAQGIPEDAWQAWEERYWAPHIVVRHFGWCTRPGGFWWRYRAKLNIIWLKNRGDSAFVLYGRAWANLGQSPDGPDDEPPRGGRWQNHPKPNRPESDADSKLLVSAADSFLMAQLTN